MTARPHHFDCLDGYGYRCDGCLTVWRLGPEVARPLDAVPECPVCLARVAMDRVKQLEAARAADNEDLARLINGLVEAGDLLMLHVQRIDRDPRPSDVARECWRESRAAISGAAPAPREKREEGSCPSP